MAEFNTKEYGYTSLHASAMGREITSLLGLKYKTTHEKNHMHTMQSDPVSIQSGKKTYSGELRLTQSELKALNDKAHELGYDDVTDFPFDISVAYSPKKLSESARIETKILKGCEISEFEEGMVSGDAFAEISLPFLFLKVKY